MKPNVRILGIDDAPFRFGDAETEAVGVVVRAPSYVEGVMMTHVAVDGRDATARLAAMIGRSRYRANLALVLLDGAALGGVTGVDIARAQAPRSSGGGGPPSAPPRPGTARAAPARSPPRPARPA